MLLPLIVVLLLSSACSDGVHPDGDPDGGPESDGGTPDGGPRRVLLLHSDFSSWRQQNSAQGPHQVVDGWYVGTESSFISGQLSPVVSDRGTVLAVQPGPSFTLTAAPKGEIDPDKTLNVINLRFPFQDDAASPVPGSLVVILDYLGQGCAGLISSTSFKNYPRAGPGQWDIGAGIGGMPSGAYCVRVRVEGAPSATVRLQYVELVQEAYVP